MNGQGLPVIQAHIGKKTLISLQQDAGLTAVREQHGGSTEKRGVPDRHNSFFSPGTWSPLEKALYF